MVIIYKVYHKDYEQKRCRLIGVLHERRKDLRGMTRVESGLRFARLAFGNLVNDKRVIIVVPKELSQGKERWVSLLRPEPGTWTQELGTRNKEENRNESNL